MCWVPEGSLAGSWGCVFEAWPAREPGKAFKNVGASPPTFLKAFPGPGDRPDLTKAPQKFSQTAFRFPVIYAYMIY